MKAKLVRNVKKLAAVATGALFVGATLGMASVFASGLSSLPGPFVSNGHVNAVFVVGANAAPTDILGAIDVSAALTAAAAATHSSTVSGQISIGTLALKSKASTSSLLSANATVFSSGFSPSSINLAADNFTSGKNNYTSVENLTFTTSKPEFNGLNIELPKGAYSLESFITNRSKNSNKVTLGLTDAVPLNDTVGLANASFFFGNAKDTLLSINKDNASFGASKSFTTVLMPATLTVAGNTIDLLGAVEDIANASQSQVEVSVNGGSVQYINLNAANTVGPVILTPRGLFKYTNGTAFLKSLQVSSTSLTQRINNSAAKFSGLTTLNVTNGTNEFSLTSTQSGIINYNFKNVSTFNFPENLTVLDLEPLTHVYSGGVNLTVTAGAAVTDSLIPVALTNTSATSLIAFNYTNALPGVAFGTDFRGSTHISPSNLYGSPDFYLEHYSVYNNGTFSSPQYINGSSEYVYPTPAHARYSYSTLPTFATGISGKAMVYYNKSSGSVDNVVPSSTKDTVNFVYELPNGKDFMLDFSPVVYKDTVTVGATHSGLTYNVSVFAMYNSTNPPTSATPINTSKIYNLDGYNLTLKLVNVTLNEGNSSKGGNFNKTVKIVEPQLTGPSLTFAPNGSTYSMLPGGDVIYNTEGASMNKLNLTKELGSITFSNNALTYMEPTGSSVSIPIGENTKSFTTYFTNVKNASADMWGTKINYPGSIKTYDNASSTGTATIMIPTQNYTLAVAGSQVVSGVTNYTIGQTVGAGKLLGISGVSTINAGSLINSNPDLAIVDNNFTGATNSVPVIVMGGPAINTLAETLLNLTAPVYGSQFTSLTGVGANEAIIQMFNSVSGFNNQPALWIAGYSSSGTLEASEVLAESLVGQPVVSLTGNKVILSTASSSYKGVTVVTNSSS